MKISDLYKREPESTDKFTYRLWGSYYSHVPEITDYYALPDDVPGFEFRTYKCVNFDERRIWLLGAVYFRGKPVMVIQNAGREGDDWACRFITDMTAYVEMVAFMKSLFPPDKSNNTDFVQDVEADIPELDNFYGHALASFDAQEKEQQ